MITVKLTFTLAFYVRFLSGLSQPLGTIDTVSMVYRPSQTVHLQVFSCGVSDVMTEG